MDDLTEEELLNQWHIREIRTDDRPNELMSGGCPASLLSHDAQWHEYIDPDTGEECSSFIGPTFHGHKISIDLQRKDDAECSVSLSVFFDDGRERMVCGSLTHESRVLELSPRKSGQYVISITLIPFKDEEKNNG